MTDATETQPQLELIPSRHFTAWLASRQVSLAITTQQSGERLLVGLQPNGRLSILSALLIVAWVSTLTAKRYI